ncbi:MAG: adenine phosphoribosyltransferase [Phycisphaera sp.]|nr:adenine phosphoribosyltransferase [Phycisphaera sp.]
MKLDLKQYIREIPDWPKPGINFKDITPLLKSPAALAMAIEIMVNPFRGMHVDIVAGAESRGFIFGTAIAQSLGAGFVPIRKPGKLPWDKHSMEYELEYGTDTLEVHTDAVAHGQRILLADDLLATGGTMKACCDLVHKMGCELVGVTFLIELTFLNGRERLKPYDHHINVAMQY